jgi:formate-dependent nitrite reductase cytochrome c552 subunit
MKWFALFTAVLVAGSGVARCQVSNASVDVLGAHLNYGRGCAACHAPHSGAAGNGDTKTADAESGTNALWGEDVTGLYGKTIRTGGGEFVETLPSDPSAGTPDVMGVLACLSCHDGNIASRTIMRNQVYEALPATYGKYNTIPTLLGDGSSPFGEPFNHHPVGLNVEIKCGGGDGWDCSSSEGVIKMGGARSSLFVKNYGLFIKPGKYHDRAVVVCTTCHDPHLMNVVNVGPGTRSGLPEGHYTTMFFLRGPYNPASMTRGNNQAAQFCRQCHAGESNEMNGGTEGTVF